MDRLPLLSTVACVGLLVFAAPAALANNNNKSAPSHPAPAAHPAVAAPHPGGPAAGGGRPGMPGAANMPGRGGPAMGANRPFGAGAPGQAGGPHPNFAGPGGTGGRPFGGPAGNNMAGASHGAPNMAGGPHPNMAGPEGRGAAPYHAAATPGAAPHGGPQGFGPGAHGPAEHGLAEHGLAEHGAGEHGPAGFGNAAAHNVGGPAHAGFAGHPNFAPAAHVTPVGGAHALSHHDVVEHRAESARRFGPGHDAARDREFVHMHEHDFHTRDVRDFDDGERARWADGAWHDDWHYGRYGWWYQVDDVWYPYDSPVYPYPVTVSEIVVPDTVLVDTRPELVATVGGNAVAMATPLAVATVTPTGEEMVVRPLPAAPVVTYNCTTYSNVYPAVRLCPITWAVVAQ